MGDPGPGNSERPTSVLICEDHQAMRDLLVLVVEMRQGLSVAGEAADGVEAIVEAERLQPDVILLDLSMPRLTGLDALPDILRVAPRARVIALSGFAASVVAGNVLAAGAHRYLEKGVDPQVIADAIEMEARAPARGSVESGPAG